MERKAKSEQISSVLDSHGQNNGVDLEAKENFAIKISTQVFTEFNFSKSG